MDWQEWALSGAIVGAVVGAQVKKNIPSALFFLIAAASTGLLGITPAKEFMHALTCPAMLAIVALLFVYSAMDKAGLFQKISELVWRKPSRLRLFVGCGVLGAFLDHTRLLLNLLPVLWKKEKRVSAIALPVSCILILGSCCTLIGAPTNLVVNQLLDNALTFFDLGKIGIPVAALGLVYLLFVSYRLCVPEYRFAAAPHAVVPLESSLRGHAFATGSVYRSGAPETSETYLERGDLLVFHDTSEAARDLEKFNHGVTFSKKSYLVLAVALAMLGAMVCGVSVALAAMCACGVLFVMGALTFKALKWELIIYVFSGLLLAYALRQTSLPSRLVLDLPIIPTCFVATFILAHCVPKIIAVSLIFPFAEQLAPHDIKTVAMTLIFAAAAACLTPFSSPTHTIVYRLAGYHPSDYLRATLPIPLLFFLFSLLV